jgi:hypothetical protein
MAEKVFKEKIFKASIQHRHDLEANWNAATTYIPLQGEIIVYDAEVDAAGNVLDLPVGRTSPYLYERFKICDGITPLINLPFMGQTSVQIITWETGD